MEDLLKKYSTQLERLWPEFYRISVNLGVMQVSHPFLNKMIENSRDDLPRIAKIIIRNAREYGTAASTNAFSHFKAPAVSLKDIFKEIIEDPIKPQLIEKGRAIVSLFATSPDVQNNTPVLEQILVYINSQIKNIERDHLGVILDFLQSPLFQIPKELEQLVNNLRAIVNPDLDAIEEKIKQLLGKEQIFLTQVVVPLLKSLKFKEIWVTSHIDRTLEYGQDALFSFDLPTGHRLYFAVQVKASDVEYGTRNIDNNAQELLSRCETSKKIMIEYDPSAQTVETLGFKITRNLPKDINSILTQCKMMLGYPTWDKKIRGRFPIDHALLITSGEIKPGARVFIAERLLREDKFVLFLDRHVIKTILNTTKDSFLLLQLNNLNSTETSYSQL